MGDREGKGDLQTGAVADRHEGGMPRIRSRRRGPSLQALTCALLLLGVSTLGFGLLYADADRVAPSLPASIVAAAISAQPAPAIALVRRESALLDPATNGGFAPAPFGRSAPLRGWFDGTAEPTVVQAAREAALESMEPGVPDVADAPAAAVASPEPGPLAREIPLPAARPALAERSIPSRSRQLASREAPTAPAPPGDGRTLLERMFGAPRAPAADPALAYATPGETGAGVFGSRTPSSADSGTAVYNIVRHTVTLPDGTQLEAHSGLGVHLDDPGSVAERMRGATPPTIYELTPRETPFHGVRALRLTPLLEGTTFGRGGLLAHTFMLGPRGDSNGCVVFRNYGAFLAAYEAGRIRRLLVVAGT